MTYQRQSDRGILTPVTYRFVCCELEEVPPLFEETFQPGDTLFQLVSVTQRTDLLPEQESQVIEISTAEELLAAAKRINESGYLQQNDTYLLTADIDLTGVEWTPIGFNERVLTFQDEDDPERDPSRQGFNGVFDGQGHTITGLTITEEQGAAFIEVRSKNFPKETHEWFGIVCTDRAERHSAGSPTGKCPSVGRVREWKPLCGLAGWNLLRNSGEGLSSGNCERKQLYRRYDRTADEPRFRSSGP